MYSTFLMLLSLLSMQIATPLAVDASIEWTYSLGSAPTSKPVLADGRAFISTWNGLITAVDTESKNLAWQAVPGEPAASSVAVANGLVYVPGSVGTLFVLNAETGTTEVARSLSTDPLITPLVHDDTIVVGSMDGQIYFLDRESLELREQFVVGTELSGPGILAGNVAVFTRSDGIVVTFDVEQRELLWQSVVGTEAGLPYALDEGDVVVSSNDGTITRLSIEDGATIWQQVKGGRALDFAQSDNGLLVITEDGALHNLDVETGTSRWQHVLLGEGGFGSETCEEICIFSDGVDVLSSIRTETGAVTEIAVAPGKITDKLAANQDVAVAVTEAGDIVVWSLGAA